MTCDASRSHLADPFELLVGHAPRVVVAVAVAVVGALEPRRECDGRGERRARAPVAHRGDRAARRRGEARRAGRAAQRGRDAARQRVARRGGDGALDAERARARRRSGRERGSLLSEGSLARAQSETRPRLAPSEGCWLGRNPRRDHAWLLLRLLRRLGCRRGAFSVGGN